jgi:hypothetical protein
MVDRSIDLERRYDTKRFLLAAFRFRLQELVVEEHHVIQSILGGRGDQINKEKDGWMHKTAIPLFIFRARKGPSHAQGRSIQNGPK